MIRQLAQAASLEAIQVRSPVLPLRGLGLRRFARRVPIVVIRQVISRLINFAFHDNQPKVVTPNMVAVLRKVQGSVNRNLI
jgi:hypothetical protein